MKRGRKPQTREQVVEFMSQIQPLMDKGLRQVQIAEALGISQATVSKRVNRYLGMIEND